VKPFFVGSWTWQVAKTLEIEKKTEKLVSKMWVLHGFVGTEQNDSGGLRTSA
jgi:hypothetical protein